jgi:DNA-directed RNA polymerase subunit M/transcription elongation factor TFIIS
MSEESDLCPNCTEGHMEPEKGSVSVEAQGQFKETASTREFVCDKCGHKHVNAGLNEYVSASDSVSLKNRTRRILNNQNV